MLYPGHSNRPALRRQGGVLRWIDRIDRIFVSAKNRHPPYRPSRYRPTVIPAGLYRHSRVSGNPERTALGWYCRQATVGFPLTRE